MSPLKLYNSMTEASESFKPRRRGRVKLFTCGPSVYRRQLCGAYRDKLDLRLSRLEQKAGRLDRLCRLIDTLSDRRDHKPTETDTDPAARMRTAFEERMNDDLDCAGDSGQRKRGFE